MIGHKPRVGGRWGSEDTVVVYFGIRVRKWHQAKRNRRKLLQRCEIPTCPYADRSELVKRSVWCKRDRVNKWGPSEGENHGVWSARRRTAPWMRGATLSPLPTEVNQEDTGDNLKQEFRFGWQWKGEHLHLRACVYSVSDSWGRQLGESVEEGRKFEKRQEGTEHLSWRGRKLPTEKRS